MNTNFGTNCAKRFINQQKNRKMKTTGNTTKRIKVAFLILTLMGLSATFSIAQPKPATVYTAEYGFNLSGTTVNDVSLTMDHEWMKIDIEEAIALEPWMVDVEIFSERSALENETEPEPQLESWMTDLSTWELQ